MPSETTTVPTIELNDGYTIPQLGFGVFQIPPEDTADAVARRLEVGYRHIDTAEMYGNEQGVGEAVRASGLDRADVFVTSKLNNAFHRPDDARRAFDETLAALGFDYVDLFLIHWPLPTLYDGDFVSTWRALEEFQRDGRARSIGVSNFQVAHLERLAAETDTVPAVNQIELHPYFLNDEVRRYGEAHGIATEAWSPIAQGKVLDDPVIAGIAERVDRTPAQVVLRWHLQRGSIVFPKSTTPARIRENFELFDFELAPQDVEKISALDRGEAGPHRAEPGHVRARAPDAVRSGRGRLAGDREPSRGARVRARAAGRRRRAAHPRGRAHLRQLAQHAAVDVRRHPRREGPRTRRGRRLPVEQRRGRGVRRRDRRLGQGPRGLRLRPRRPEHAARGLGRRRRRLPQRRLRHRRDGRAARPRGREKVAVLLTFGRPAKPRDPARRSPEEWLDRADRRPFDDVVRDVD